MRLKRGRARQDWPHAPYRYGLTPPDRWGLFIPIPTFRTIKETIMPSNITRKLYSATGKIHLRQQEENQKENAI